MRIERFDPDVENIPDAVESTLPDPAALQNLGGSDLARSVLVAQSALVNAQIMSQATQIAFKGIVSGVGAPAGMFNAMATALKVDVAKTTTQVLEQIAGSIQNALGKMDENSDMLSDAVDAGVGKAVNLAAAIPVVGWIIKIAWNIGKAIADIAILIRDQKDPKFLYPPSRFDPTTDRDVLNNAVLSPLRGDDWSKLFYPPGVGWKPSDQNIKFYFSPMEGGGIRIVTAGPKGAESWVGFVPGTATLHQAIEVFSAQKIYETGRTLLPSATQQALWIWRHVSRTNTPGAFTVHADRAKVLWQTYIEDMRVAINEVGSGTLKAKTKEEIFERYDKAAIGKSGKVSPLFGWGDGSKEKEYAPTKLLTTLRDRQLAFCDTLTVGYLDETFGALQDIEIRDKVRQRKKDLLEHPAVCQLDLSNIRDILYLEEVVKRRAGQVCKQSPTALKFVSGSSKPPEIVDGFAIPDLRLKPTPKKSSGGVILGIGGIVAALLLLRKK